MHVIRQEIQVTFSYAVYGTADLFAPGNPLLRDVVAADAAELPKKLLFVVDRGVQRHHPQLLRAIADYCRAHADVMAPARAPLLVEGGEAAKNDARQVTAVLEAIHAAGLCRHAYVVAVGGGAVLDAVGYAAATAHRGVRLIRVPTTVLAQCDAAVGVKNGINAFGKKNFLGTFAPPCAVINDAGFLHTLSARDWRAGMAEAVKVALLKDPVFFAYLEQHAADLAARDMRAMEKLIRRCAELHLEHIAGNGDPFELGSSRPLDHGHWSAHKLEQLSGYALRHGEAVAIGIALDATYAYLSGALGLRAWRRILHLLAALGFALWTPELGRHLDAATHPQSIFAGLAEFREHLGGRLTITLLQDIGRPFEVHEMDLKLLADAIALLHASHTDLQGGNAWISKLAHAR